MDAPRFGALRLLSLVLGVCALVAGCHPINSFELPAVPNELKRASLAEYRIRPPDVLLIDMLRAVPIPPHKIEPLDLLFIQATGTPPEDPIKGLYRVEPEGIVRLGPAYGSVEVADLTVKQATEAVEKHLRKILNKTDVLLTVEQTRGIQQIRGEHLVRPDGNVSLGIYGMVRVAGLTQTEVRTALEAHLTQFFVRPSVSVDVAGFNSHVIYVLFDGAGNGEQLIRLPYTGNDTVLDAVGNVFGLPAVAAKSRMWVARPCPGTGDQILPVDWVGITQRGEAVTNYQLLPQDRIYVASQPLVVVDTYLGRLIAPMERLFGIVLLGNTTVQSIRAGENSVSGGAGVR